MKPEKRKAADVKARQEVIRQITEDRKLAIKFYTVEPVLRTPLKCGHVHVQ